MSYVDIVECIIWAVSLVGQLALNIKTYQYYAMYFNDICTCTRIQVLSYTETVYGKHNRCVHNSAFSNQVELFRRPHK